MGEMAFPRAVAGSREAKLVVSELEQPRQTGTECRPRLYPEFLREYRPEIGSCAAVSVPHLSCDHQQRKIVPRPHCSSELRILLNQSRDRPSQFFQCWLVKPVLDSKYRQLASC